VRTPQPSHPPHHLPTASLPLTPVHTRLREQLRRYRERRRASDCTQAYRDLDRVYVTTDAGGRWVRRAWCRRCREYIDRPIIQA